MCLRGLILSKNTVCLSVGGITLVLLLSGAELERNLQSCCSLWERVSSWALDDPQSQILADTYSATYTRGGHSLTLNSTIVTGASSPPHHHPSTQSRTMDELANELAESHSTGNGYQVAQILLPIPPPDRQDRLKSIWKGTNAASVKKDISKAMRKSSYLKNLPDDEFTGWVDILTAYWKAVSEIVSMTEPADSGKVDKPPHESPLENGTV